MEELLYEDKEEKFDKKGLGNQHRPKFKGASKGLDELYF